MLHDDRRQGRGSASKYSALCIDIVPALTAVQQREIGQGRPPALWSGSAAPDRRVTQVGIAAHIARLRAVIGHELLLVPSVSVLPVDEAGRVLLVRHAGHDDGWGVLGGAVDVGESPAAAAVRGL